MAEKFRKFDVTELLKTEEDINAFLAECFNEYPNEPEFLAHAVGAAARARGMSKIAKQTGLSRESLYRSFSKQGNPRFDTLLKVLSALGVKLQISA